MEVGDQQGELSCPVTTAKPNRKKTPLLSWQGLSQWKAMDSWLPTPSQRPSSPFLLLCGYLHVAPHGCRSQTAILCWPWINPPLLEKYLAASLFQVKLFVIAMARSGKKNIVHRFLVRSRSPCKIKWSSTDKGKPREFTTSRMCYKNVKGIFFRNQHKRGRSPGKGENKCKYGNLLFLFKSWSKI